MMLELWCNFMGIILLVFMNKILLFLIFLIASNLTFSQIPITIKNNADSILTSISTKEVFDKTFHYNCLKSSIIIRNAYWSDCKPLTENQKELYAELVNNKNEKEYEIVFDCLLLDTIQELVKINLDEEGNLIRISNLPSKEIFKYLTGLSITRKKAEEISLNSGFKQGLDSLEIYLTFDNLTKEAQQYYWCVKNTLVLGDKHGCYASGEIIYIDALNGKIILKNYWESECVY